MQTAQRILSAYRRRRFTICALLALLVFAATLSLSFITERQNHAAHIQRFNQQAVASINALLAPLSGIHHASLPLMDMPCHNAEFQMRTRLIPFQTIRSVSLIRNGIIYCSSVFGALNRPVTSFQPDLPTVIPRLYLVPDPAVNIGVPILLSWFPRPGYPRDGVLQIMNINVLTGLMQASDPPWINQTILNIADAHFAFNRGLINQISPSGNEKRYDTASDLHAFSITTLGPSATFLALNSLPATLPLALILSLLTGYLAWLISARHLSFSREIHHGLAAKEFKIFCQPLIEPRAQKCLGIELLLRWDNPRQGNLSPDIFIPLAEQQGVIIPLTRYILKEAACFLPQLPVSSCFHIGINVAACHFQHNVIIEDLKKYWFPAMPVVQLIIELTERDALSDIAYRTIPELHELGVKLAIDDFGTGHSSLAYLEQLNPDILKIDKSFTAAIGTDAVNSTVIDMIINLGRRLKVTLIAEGVETPEQAAFLHYHNVDLLQGYLYSEPMPLDDFPAWLNTHSVVCPTR